MLCIVNTHEQVSLLSTVITVIKFWFSKGNNLILNSQTRLKPSEIEAARWIAKFIVACTHNLYISTMIFSFHKEWGIAYHREKLLHTVKCCVVPGDISWESNPSNHDAVLYCIIINQVVIILISVSGEVV